jgi:hypothetical protein
MQISKNTISWRVPGECDCNLTDNHAFMRHLVFSITMPVLLAMLTCCMDQPEAGDGQASVNPKKSQQVANQIVYDVIIKNPDPKDEWTEQCLMGLKREELVDFIFKGLYDERFKAYDIFNDQPISQRRIRKMEADGEFSREQVSKIQFVEDWYLDPESHSMFKRVTEVRLGLEHFDGFGMHLGHNPLFKVRMVE